MWRPRPLFTAFLLTFLVAWALPSRADFVPDPKKLAPPTGYVTDLAGVLDGATHQELEALLTELDQKTTAQVAVLTVPSLGEYEPNDFAVAVYENWKIGKKGKDNGVLFLIAPSEHKMFINTGYGLEGDLPDARCNAIVALVRPYFQQGQMSQGVAAGTKAIAAEIAAAANVQLTGNPGRAPEEERRARRRTTPLEMAFVILFMIVIFALRSRLYSRGIWGGPGGGMFMGGMGGGFGGGGGGGFGGFGGGSTGGGGAGGSW
jgi:uncharacterized protein